MTSQAQRGFISSYCLVLDEVSLVSCDCLQWGRDLCECRRVVLEAFWPRVLGRRIHSCGLGRASQLLDLHLRSIQPVGKRIHLLLAAIHLFNAMKKEIRVSE